MASENPPINRPHLERIIGYEFAKSYPLDSEGHRLQRLIDNNDEPQLGTDAWKIGHEAYLRLTQSDHTEVNEYSLSKIRRESHIALDEQFDCLQAFIDSGQITIEFNGKSAKADEIDWPHQDVTWKVLLFSSLKKQVDNKLDQPLTQYCLVSIFWALDNAVIASRLGDTECASNCLLDANRLLEYVIQDEVISQAVGVQLRSLDSQRASARAKTRHAADPKSKARQFVHDCWQKWELQPDLYPSAAAFARDMLDKQPDALTSDVVITRWVRDWRKARR